MSIELRPNTAIQTELQTKKLLLENQALLLKSTTPDGAAAPTQMQEAVEEAIEEVSTQLQKAKAAPVLETASPSPTQADEAVRASSLPRLDRYEESTPLPTPGTYAVEPDPDEGYRVSFQPYSEP